MNSHFQSKIFEQHGFAKPIILLFPVLAVFLITSFLLFWNDLSLKNVVLFGFAALFYKLNPAICSSIIKLPSIIFLKLSEFK